MGQYSNSVKGKYGLTRGIVTVSSPLSRDVYHQSPACSSHRFWQNIQSAGSPVHGPDTWTAGGISAFNHPAPAASRRVCGAATTGSSGHQVCHFVLLLHFAPFVRPRENVIIIGSSFLSCHVVSNTLVLPSTINYSVLHFWKNKNKNPRSRRQTT